MTAVDAVQLRRQQVAAGYHRLAEIIASQPGVPLPTDGLGHQIIIAAHTTEQWDATLLAFGVSKAWVDTAWCDTQLGPVHIRLTNLTGDVA